jgi:hypothetical protein
VLRIGTGSIVTDHGSIATGAGEVHVDCTAAGVQPTVARPIFEPDRITLQYVTLGIVPWSAATVAAVEAKRDDDVEKNRLCPPLVFSGDIADVLSMVQTGMVGLMARGTEPDLAAWTEASRLNPAHGALNHLDDPRVPQAYASLADNIGAAMRNLAHRVRARAST